MRAFFAALMLLAAAPSVAGASSLYSGTGQRPGPDILYQKPATAPQLTNAGIWKAAPTLISGTGVYRKGEFLYQDFLYDDHGARGTRDSGDPRSSADTFSQPSGTYTYPTGPGYVGNAADLVELRVKPLADATAFRLTLNTLLDPSLVASTIAIGDSPAARPFPHGANTVAPAQLFLTVHGESADLLDAASGQPASVPPSVSVDTLRRQIEVRVPKSDWDPTGKVIRLAAGVGLWDKAANRYLIPGSSADTTHAGGAGSLPSPTAFFNVAFRYSEPVQSPGVDALTDPSWWRDKAQGQALASGDISGFHADVDFRKLAAGVVDDMAGQPGGVPQTGAMDRILASHFETQQGTDYTTGCGDAGPCKGELTGRLQPYAIYIPRKPAPAGGFGLTLLLHSLGASFNQFLGTRNQSQFGERGTGSIVITPSGRGPDGWYWDYAGADAFEVWADVAHRFKLDPAYTAIAGYSMGGYGTYKFATQFPDLFARAQPTVGPPGLGIWVPPVDPVPGGKASNTYEMLPSVRNIPFMIWDGAADELVPLASVVTQAQRFDQLGYRYIFDVFATSDHLLLANNDQYQPAADFLGAAKVDRNPGHITYVVNPKMDFPGVGTVADHAYWVSGLQLRSASGDAPRGMIDARSEAFGEGDPSPHDTERSSGSLDGGYDGNLTYLRQSRDWGAAPRTPIRDRLDIVATNLKTATIDVKRARLSCGVAVQVQSDGPLEVKLAGCGRNTPRLAVHLARVAHRSCRRRIAIGGPDRAGIRRVAFYVGRRLVGRDRRAPFGRAISLSGRARTLRVAILMKDDRRLTLRRTLPARAGC